MKRIISVISVLLLSIMIVLVGCSPAHEHTFSNGYGTDKTYHWRIPLCDDVEIEKIPHDFVDGVCSVCGYKSSESTSGQGSETPSDKTPSGGTEGSGSTGGETPGQSGGQSGGNQGSGESSGSQDGTQGGSSSGSEQTTPSGGTQSGGNTGSETPGQSGSQSGGTQGSGEGSGEGSGTQGGETVDPDDIYAFENQYPKDDNTITGEPDENGKITFRIRVNRYNGRKIGNYSLYSKVKIVDSQGKTVYDDIVPIWAHTMYSETELNMLDIKLDAGEYKVYPYNIPEGFEYEESYTINSEHPLLDLKLTCHPLENKTLDKIDVNMVMPNITIKSVNKGTTTLNELLKEGQIVVFMFFNSGCYWCREEAPTFKKIYEENPGKITYVFFDNADDEDRCINTVKSWYGDELAEKLYIVCDKKEDKLYNKLVNGGHVPRNVYIDNGGYVFLVTAGTPEEWLNRILYFNAFKMPEKQTSQSK